MSARQCDDNLCVDLDCKRNCEDLFDRHLTGAYVPLNLGRCISHEVIHPGGIGSPSALSELPPTMEQLSS